MFQPQLTMPQIGDPERWSVPPEQLRREILLSTKTPHHVVLPDPPPVDPLAQIIEAGSLPAVSVFNNFHLRICPQLRFYSEEQLQDPTPLGERIFRSAAQRNAPLSYESFRGRSVMCLQLSISEYVEKIDRTRRDVGVTDEMLNEFAVLYRGIGWVRGPTQVFLEIAPPIYRALRAIGFSHDDLV